MLSWPPSRALSLDQAAGHWHTVRVCLLYSSRWHWDNEISRRAVLSGVHTVFRIYRCPFFFFLFCFHWYFASKLFIKHLDCRRLLGIYRYQKRTSRGNDFRVRAHCARVSSRWLASLIFTEERKQNAQIVTIRHSKDRTMEISTRTTEDWSIKIECK